MVRWHSLVLLSNSLGNLVMTSLGVFLGFLARMKPRTFSSSLQWPLAVARSLISGPVVSAWLPWGFYLVVFSIERSDSLDIDYGWYLCALQPQKPRLAFHWQDVIPILVEEVNHFFENRFAERTIDEVACAQKEETGRTRKGPGFLHHLKRLSNATVAGYGISTCHCYRTIFRYSSFSSWWG